MEKREASENSGKLEIIEIRCASNGLEGCKYIDFTVKKKTMMKVIKIGKYRQKERESGNKAKNLISRKQ